MIIDLTLLLNGRENRIDFTDTISPEELTDEVAMLPQHIKLQKPMIVSGSIENNHGYMSLDAVVSVEYITQCDRCLAEITETEKIPFSRLVAAAGKTGLLTEEQGIDPDELLEACDSTLDATAAIIEEVALGLSNYHLCRPDCPGLCPKCGKKLADGPCGCAAKKEIDPRLAILQKLLDNTENV